jgi:tight adherence protein C
MHMALVGLGLLFAGVALVAVRWYSRRKRQAAPSRPTGDSVPALLRTFSPLIRQLACYNRLLPLSFVRDRYARQIERAGLRFELSVDEFLAIQEIAFLAMVVVAFLIQFTLVQNWAVTAAISLIGLLYPLIRLSAAVGKQKRACLRALPGFLDLLVLAVEAGMGFDSAVRKLTDVLPSAPLVWAFRVFLRSMNVGRPRAEALREMARKLDLADFTILANAVIHATETGASMGPVLRTESREMLLRRFERAEKSASELPVKILFPLFAFIFPATFLMILGPLYFQFVASGAAGAL